MSLKNQIRIGVFGGSDCSHEIYEKARKVGQLLAQENILVFCGGRGGVMEAVSQGVMESGGIVIGILPGSYCFEANKYISIPIATGAGSARNVMIANTIQGAIAIDGSYGTLSEIGHTLKQNKPVVGLQTWEIKGITPADSPQEAVQLILSLI